MKKALAEVMDESVLATSLKQTEQHLDTNETSLRTISTRKRDTSAENDLVMVNVDADEVQMNVLREGHGEVDEGNAAHRAVSTIGRGTGLNVEDGKAYSQPQEGQDVDSVKKMGV